MREVKTKVYLYAELSEKAKDKAREWWLSVDDGSWAWDSTAEDAQQIGLKITSLDPRHTNEGEFITSARDTVRLILENHGPECETYKTAERYKKAFDDLQKFLDADDYDSFHEQSENTEHEFLHELLEDYRVMLEKEQEYQQSEEYIAETMEANAYEFTKDGKRFHE